MLVLPLRILKKYFGAKIKNVINYHISYHLIWTHFSFSTLLHQENCQGASDEIILFFYFFFLLALVAQLDALPTGD